MEEATRTSRVALRPGDSSGGENTSWPGLRCGELPGFRGDALVCQFHAADYGVNARVVLPGGFGVAVAAGFCVLQLRVQEGAKAPALAIFHPDPVTKSFLHVGDVMQSCGVRTLPAQASRW